MRPQTVNPQRSANMAKVLDRSRVSIAFDQARPDQAGVGALAKEKAV